MATHLNFRSSIGGFNREDVVHYIEYMNSKHTAQVNQLNNQMEELRQELEKLKALPDLSADVAALQAQLAESTAQTRALLEENATLLRQRDEAMALVEAAKVQQAERAAKELTALELEAYRRAEQAERMAKARAEQIYQQATGTLAQATNQVDAAATSFKQIAEQVNQQMALLQVAVDTGKNALLDAATTMYSIRTENTAE